MSSTDDDRFEQEIPANAKKSQEGGLGSLGILVLPALLLVSATAILLGYFVSISLAVYIGVPLLCLVLIMTILGYAYHSASAPVVMASDNVEPPLSCAALTPEEKSLKIVLVGDARVGKTQLMARYTQNTYTEAYESTVGVEFGSKQTDDGTRLSIWDAAGRQEFRSITQQYLRDADAILIVYAITHRRSFDSVPAWIEKTRGQAPNTPLVLVGCQRDRADQRQVTYEEAYKFAEQHGLRFFETSAKSGLGLQEAFETWQLPPKRLSRAYSFDEEMVSMETLDGASIPLTFK